LQAISVVSYPVRDEFGRARSDQRRIQASRKKNTHRHVGNHPQPEGVDHQCFEFVGELTELVEIDSGPEPERMRNGLRFGAPTCLRLLAETGTERQVDHILERHPEFPRASLQEAGQVVVDGECDTHGLHPWV